MLLGVWAGQGLGSFISSLEDAGQEVSVLKDMLLAV